MNILIATQFKIPHGGGLSAHVTDLIQCLAEEGHSITLIQGKQVTCSMAQRLLSHICSLGNKDNYRKVILETQLLNLTQKITAALGRSHLDIIHCHDPVAGYAAFLANKNSERKVKVIETIHGPLAYETKMMINQEIHQSQFLKRLWDIEKLAFSSADKLIAVDTGQGRIAIEDFGVDKSRVTIIFNAVSCKNIASIISTDSRISVPSPYVLVPRRLVHKNGVHIAIEALAKIPDLHMIIAGDGILRADLEALARRLGLNDRVIFLGSIDRNEVLRLEKNALGVVISSIPSAGVIEATSIAALEAMACGTAVIASNIGGLLEIIADGKTGILVPHSNPNALANALQNLVANSEMRNCIALQGKEFVSQNLDIAIWLKKIKQVYADVMK